jgi:CBS domain-containing protein
LGFSHVYDYLAGKKDWLAAGLTTEGKRAGQVRAGHLSRPNPPTCRPDERVGDVRRRLGSDGWDACIVVNDHDVVEGRIRPSDLADVDGETLVEEVMELGPTSIRPDAGLESIVKRVRNANVASILVTSSSGELLGVLYREDAERHLDE